ncbi:MAG: hypothetical protein WAK18_06225 [Nocardioidaceae bacterium]
MTFSVLTLIVAAAVVTAWYVARLAHFVKSDGYGFRSASGLPRDWSPSVDLPSTPYAKKPHH